MGKMVRDVPVYPLRQTSHDMATAAGRTYAYSHGATYVLLNDSRPKSSSRGGSVDNPEALTLHFK